MNMSAVFIHRPVATTLIMAGILVFGMLSYFQLPQSDMPNADLPYIIVTATMSGADPETMASSVAKPLERQLSTISSIKSMTSTSKQGMTMVFLEFELDRDIDGASIDVQSAISRAYSSMPETMNEPPRFMKLNPDFLPVIQIALTSDSMTQQELTSFAETYVSDRLSMIKGVSQSQVRGAKRFAVRIRIDPDLMVARDVSVEDISKAVEDANVTLPTGTLQGEERIRNIKADGELVRAKEFADIIVAWRNGAPVRLSDVAHVEDSVEETNQASWINGRTGVVVQVTRQPGGNTVQVVRDIMNVLPSIAASLPPSVNMEVVEDGSLAIRDSVAEVQFTLILTIFLVVAVIYVFLRDGMATIIPSLALPLSIVATFAFMFAMDFSLDNLSLMALILAVGFVVDDAIVMLENIMRHREMGKKPIRAALDGSAEVGFTILSMTISLAAVFIPLLFMPGVAGRMFFEFAAVLIIAIFMSLLVSISLTPMMGALFLTEKSVHIHYTGFKAVMERGFNACLRGYERSLHWTMRHKFLVFVGSLLLIAATGVIATWVPMGFFPAMDGGKIAITTRAEESISFDALAEAQVKLHDIIAADPAVASYVSTVGGGVRRDANTGQITVRLKPINEREHIDVVINRLRRSLGNSPTLNVYVRNGDGQGRTNTTGGQYSYALVSSSLEALYAATPRLEEAMKGMASARDVGTDLQLLNPILKLSVDRDKALSLGITLRQIEDALYSAFGTRQISTIYTDTRDYTVKMEVLPELQYKTDILDSIYVRSGAGMLVPLATLTTFSSEAGPLSVNHDGQFPSVKISFNTAPGYSLSQTMRDIEDAARDILPAEVSGKFTGTAQDFESSVNAMILLIIVALILIYIVLGILYESFIHPITILSGLPSAGFGALFSLWIFDAELSMTAFVGIIMLIGIVKKNAIMVLDFSLEAERTRNLSPDEAVLEGCLIRFRPILMTTFAAVMGALPLAAGMGATGADMRQPIGICVAGGLLFSQLVTLYITPVYYVYLDRFGHSVSRLMARLFRRNLANQEDEARGDGQA